MLAALYALGWWWPSVWLAPLLWLAQGTMFWALFVIGHDCGHGTFSSSATLNTFVGHLTHTPLLVPYHAWRVSHRTHHRHVGLLERDEGWVPLTAPAVDRLPWLARQLRLRWVLPAFPFYLLRNGPGRVGSHFNPRAALFPARERRRTAFSIALCMVVLAVWMVVTWVAGPGAVVRWFLGPWCVFVVWIDLVTFLHHTEATIPWYRAPAWTPLAGALATIDRHYGVFERLHHDAGCHVVHHLFPNVPHYHLRAVARVVQPVLGELYRVAREPVLSAFLRAVRAAYVVPAVGEVVHYERYVGGTVPRPVGRGAGVRPATR